MDQADKRRMEDLLRKNRRRKLVPGIVQKWAGRGIAASPLSDERQRQLLGELRAWDTSEYRPVVDVQVAICEFLEGPSLVVVVGFDVNEEPALLVPAHALSASEQDLRAVYPDGFVLIREEAALIIDFEEDGGRVNVSYATAC
jgi:hypothetical protein